MPDIGHVVAVSASLADLAAAQSDVRFWVDCVAKVPNRGATIFPPEDETSRDHRLI